MHVYNFGIHSFNKENGVMYCWDESKGGIASQKIATALAKHLKQEAREHTHMILYWD